MIKAQNLVKKYNGFTAVDDVSFDVAKGKIVAFLGPNGAGKTTVIKIFTTLLKPTSGTVYLDGVNAAEHPDDARRKFGIVFQDPSLDDELSAYENVELHAVMYGVPKKQREERIEKLLKFVELWDRRDDMVKKYSGGMKRRLEIARALVHHPKILFLDEPTLGLDPQTKNHMWNYIRQINKEEGMTVFFTTHYMEEADTASDEIIIIDRGKIIDRGTSDELKQKTGATTLEEAFLSLTGKTIRDEDASGADAMKTHRRLWSHH
jgi:ABC-2 type transport system ATP-binding protein